ncbi:hypothetical protein HRbin01_00446 [archaeon HR01]|nr:hypothetical protein HRbin01_00446 [archaeon HR01]
MPARHSDSKVELECVCGTPIRTSKDLEYVTSEDGSRLVRCRNRICHLDFVAVVESYGRSITIGFSPMFSDWNLLHMGKDRLEKMLEKIGHSILLDMFGAEGKKFFRVNPRMVKEV